MMLKNFHGRKITKKILQEQMIDINQLKLKRIVLKKNMKPGNKIIFLILFIFACLNSVTYSEDKITTSPLINLDKIKPSFEEIDLKNESSAKNKKLKKKNEIKSAQVRQ